MRIFISWSGDRSKELASALKTWVGDVIQNVEPWMSEHDIQPGSRWGVDIAEELSESNFGVLCLTRENISAPWLLFEAGSLAKSLKLSRVIPYRLNLSAVEVKPPLSQFQGVDATRDGTLKLMQSINNALTESLPQDRLARLFDKFWPDLELRIQEIGRQAANEPTQVRTEIDYLQEILEIVRRKANERDLTSFETAMNEIFALLHDLQKRTDKDLHDLISRAEAAWDYGNNQTARRHWEIATRWQALKEAMGK